MKDITQGWTRIQQDVLAKIPAGLLPATVRRAILTRQFYPKPPELLADAEMARQELLKLHPYEPCETCGRTSWVPWLVDGVERMRRCECRTSWLRRLDALGAGASPLALERGKDDSE